MGSTVYLLSLNLNLSFGLSVNKEHFCLLYAPSYLVRQLDSFKIYDITFMCNPSFLASGHVLLARQLYWQLQEHFNSDHLEHQGYTKGGLFRRLVLNTGCIKSA